MRTIAAYAVRFGIVSAAAAFAMTGAIAVLNRDLHGIDLLFLELDLSVAFLALLALPTAATALLIALLARKARPTHVYAAGAVTLFALLWFARLEPAHQIVSVRPHVSRWGAAELLTIALLSLALLGAWMRATGSLGRRVAVRAGAFAGVSALLAVCAWTVEPPRSRDDAVAALAARFPPMHGASPPSRVLVIGLDGLDWRTVRWMIERGRMPALQHLLRTGRFYQHDNRALSYSPEIWTALYSGRPSEVNAVGDYAKWRFAGVSKTIAFLPRFGMHAWFFIDEFLRRTDDPPFRPELWADVPVSTRDFVAPPIWSIVSAAGRTVGVFNPVPQANVPEALNGFYAVPGDAELQTLVVSATGTRVETLSQPPSERDQETRALLGEVEAAARLFSQRPLDLAIYYTHAIDATQHSWWDYRFRGRFFGGDPAPLDEAFDATPIRQAYDVADRIVARLAAAFGEPATVIVVSDHGWRYDDYEHFRSPYGVLIVSPAETRGYSGVADVLAFAPTVLGLLRIPADSSMTAPIPPFRAERGRERWADIVTRQFVESGGNDRTRQDRLRSLGYISGRPTPAAPDPARPSGKPVQ